jgi:hypothetical protein
MQTLARVSAAALLLACASAAHAANPGTLLVLNKSDNTVSLVDLASKKSRCDDSDRQRSPRKSRCRPTDELPWFATTDRSHPAAR